MKPASILCWSQLLFYQNSALNFEEFGGHLFFCSKCEQNSWGSWFQIRIGNIFLYKSDQLFLIEFTRILDTRILDGRTPIGKTDGYSWHENDFYCILTFEHNVQLLWPNFCSAKHHHIYEYMFHWNLNNINRKIMFLVICSGSGDLLIWQNFEFWSTNICYCLLSAPQTQFKTEKKRVWLVNIFLLDQ